MKRLLTLAFILASSAAFGQSQPLSGLTSGAAISDTDLFYDVQTVGVGGTKVAASQLATYFLSKAAGANTQVQFNNSGVFGADSGFTYQGSGTATLSTVLNVPAINSTTNLLFETNSTEAMRIDTSQLATLGGFANVQIQGSSVLLELIESASASPWQFGTISYGNVAGTNGYIAAKTRGNIPSNQVIVQSGDTILDFRAAGSDGVTFQHAAAIQVIVDSAPGVASMPGRLAFLTTPSGSNNLLERARFDASGNFTQGGFANTQIAGFNSVFQQVSTDALFQLSIITIGNTNDSGGWAIAKTRGLVPTSQVLLHSGDNPWTVAVYGSDGTAYRQMTGIQAIVDSAPGSGSMPGRWVFLTSPSGAANPTEAMRIDSRQHISYTTSAPTASACTGFALATGSSDTTGRVAFNTATSCAIAFGATYTNSPFCVVTPGSANSTVEATTTTSILTATFGTSQTAMFYGCFGT